MTVVDEFEEEFKQFTHAEHAIATCNGTSALHTALTAVGVGYGDKVITTPFSFVASANSIMFNGGVPIFADINPKTYCIDPNEVEKKLDEHPTTKAILIVHLFGNTCDLERLTQIAQEKNVCLIEDCSQALGAIYRKPPRYLGAHVGNFGEFGTFSFYASKNLWTFEGGMLITNDASLAEKARMIINHGRKLDTKHEHTILGYNYRMAEPLAQIGLTMLRRHKKAILSELGSYGVEDGFYPYVIYDLPLYKELGITGDCPNAEKAAKEAERFAYTKQ